MPIITTKSEFYRLSTLGLCGNTPKIWASIHDYWPDRIRYPIIGLRRLVAASSVLTPGILWIMLYDFIDRHNLREGDYVITEVPDTSLDGLRTLQGELGWINGAWYLYYTHQGGYMRRALREAGEHAIGWRVLELLRAHCTPADYDDLMDLFDLYTEDYCYPVIEFTVFRDTNCGTIAGRNTLIWEIRHY